MKAFLFQLICIILIYQTVRNHCDVQRSLWNQFTRALGPVMLTSLVSHQSPIWARKILLSVLILIFIFPEISSIFAMSSSSLEDICSTTFSKQQRQMFKKCLKFLKRKQTRSHNRWTLPHSDLSCCQCFCAFHYICYYIILISGFL